MSKIGTLTTGVGVVTTFNLNYCPEILHFAAATALTALKVTIEGQGVICDLDSDGIIAAGALFEKGAVTNGYKVALADGFIGKKNTVISITNSAAQTPSVYGFKTGEGTVFYKSEIQKVFAGQEQLFDNFFALAIPDWATGSDQFNITDRKGFTDNWEPEDARALISLTTGIVKNTDADFYINNLAQVWSKVRYQPAADTNAYKFSYLAVK